jgi:hypothetical protein
VSFERVPISGGILPWRLLWKRSRRTKLGREEKLSFNLSGAWSQPAISIRVTLPSALQVIPYLLQGGIEVLLVLALPHHPLSSRAFASSRSSADGSDAATNWAALSKYVPYKKIHATTTMEMETEGFMSASRVSSVWLMRAMAKRLIVMYMSGEWGDGTL